MWTTTAILVVSTCLCFNVVIISGDTAGGHIKWKEVATCAHQGESSCRENNTCVDLLPGARKNETAKCWYDHRAAVKQLLTDCLDAKGISNTECWKSDGSGLLRQRFKSNSNVTSPFETALKCWFYDCLRLAACSEKCTAEKQAVMDPLLNGCIMESEKTEVPKLIKCIMTANKLTKPKST